VGTTYSSSEEEEEVVVVVGNGDKEPEGIWVAALDSAGV
jgi:hypothetical protein